jgi:hypothetical protein
MDWLAVVLVLAGGVLGIAGTLGATVLQHWLSGRARDEAERGERIRTGAAALAPIRTLLTNLEPDRLAVNASPESLQELVDLRRRWDDTLRVPLAAFALSHPSPEVRDRATRLDVHVEWVLIRGVSLVRDVLAHRDFREMQELVWRHYRDAQRLIEELHGELHGAGGNAGATQPAETSRSEPQPPTTEEGA